MQALNRFENRADRPAFNAFKNVSLLAVGVSLHTLVLLVPLAMLGTLHHVTADPIRAALVVCAELLFLVEASSIWYSAQQARATEAVRNRSYRLAALGSGAALLLMIWLALASSGEPSSVVVASGLMAMLGGVTLRGVAIHRLRGRFVSAAETDAQGPLIEAGIYRWLRHPSELGLLLFAGGAAVIGGGLLLPMIWLLAQLPLSIMRMRLEDEAHLAMHGAAFRSYRDRVGACFPTLGLFPSR